MYQQKVDPSSTMNNQGNMVAQKENDNFLKNKLEVMEQCDLNDKKFKIAVRNSTRHKKTQKGSSMSSEIKLINRRSTLTKRSKV